jgi:hypothetical protein
MLGLPPPLRCHDRPALETVTYQPAFGRLRISAARSQVATMSPF